jgi:tetratricopeptide (TPR) repeat protein
MHLPPAYARRTRCANIKVLAGGNGDLPPDFWDTPPWYIGGFRMQSNGGKIPLEVQFAYRQAVELSRLGNYEVALQRLKQVVAAAPHFANAFNEMGTCLTHMGRDREALSKFEKALKEDPFNQEASHNRSMIRRKIEENGKRAGRGS